MRTARFLILTLSLLFTGCPEEDPHIIQPPPATQCEYPAGNRNYSWRLDTVAWFPSTLGGIHAFSDSDAYLMGYIGEGKAPWNIFMAKHWNGTSWTTNTNGSYEEIRHYANDVTGDNFYMVSVGYWAIGSERAGLAEFDNRTKKWKGHQFQTQGELRSVWTDGKGYFIAVGDNGMVYIKDGYSSSWVYQKAPTEFGLYDVNGISKHEIYISAAQNLITGEHYTQGWKLEQGEWHKLYDTKDITNTPLQITNNDYPNQMGVWRCNITDSLKLIVHGDQSYLFEAKGQELKFKKTNLSSLGLPLKINGRTGTRVNIFTPNDIWFYGTRYNFYHWNGTNFQKMSIPGLPNDDTQFGWQLRPIKTTSGKLFFGSEVSSQVYIIAQGTF